MGTEQELLEYLRGSALYVYGAGVYAGRLINRLNRNGIEVQGILVTNREGNPSDMAGIRVQAAESLAGSGIDITGLTVAVALAKGQLEILDYLLSLGFEKIVLISQDIWQEIKERESGQQKVEDDYEYRLDYDYPSLEPNHCAVIEKSTGQALFRVPLYVDANLREVWREKCKRESFEALYGEFDKLPFEQGEYVSRELAQRERIELYAAVSHADKQRRIEVRKNGVIPLQVGAALTGMRLGCQTDDTGENISAENRNFCEITGLYWIWKNTAGQTYAGLIHYRRRLRWDETSVRYMIDRELDAVIILPQFSPQPVNEYFLRFICRHDWQFMKEAVLRYDNTYVDIFERYEQGHFFIPCNMAVFKRSWFDQYCEFAFAVAAEVDNRYKKMQVVRQDRYMGYLFENLLSLFLIRYHREMKVAYSDMEFIR